METGERGLYADDVAAMLGLYRVPQQRRLELLRLVRTCQEPNWWQLSDELPPDQQASWHDVIDLESRAVSIVNFETVLVPGLTQTPEYAAAVLRGTMNNPSDRVVEHLVAARVARTAVLSRRPAPALALILDEAVLRRPVGGPAVMSAQLHQLLACARRANISIQVVPYSLGATPGLDGPAVIYELGGEGTVVYAEMRGASGFLTDENAVHSAKVAMRKLAGVALPPAESARMIADAAQSFEE